LTALQEIARRAIRAGTIICGNRKWVELEDSQQSEDAAMA